MSDNLLRDAMLVEARRWLDGKPKIWLGGISVDREMGAFLSLTDDAISGLLADFVMHMTGQKAPELRYVAEGEDDQC